ncbi:class C sortase [Leucobacter sp. HY1910]
MTRRSTHLRPAAPAEKRPGRWGGFVLIAIAWLGVLAMLYPSAAQWIEQTVQNRALVAQMETTRDLPERGVNEILEEARAYNAAVAAGTGVPRDGYAKALALPGTDIIARVRVPSIEIDQPLRHGLTDETLLKGLGHAQTSSLPVGGESTHSVLGGHRGLATSVGFTRLPEMKEGDEFMIDVLGETLTYRVTSTDVLDPLAADYRPVVVGKDLVSLLTCTPLGINSHRFIVTGERVPGADTPPGAEMPTPTMPTPWWAVGAGVVTLAAGGTAIVVARAGRKPTV